MPEDLLDRASTSTIEPSFAHHLDRHEGQVALVHGDEAISYRSLAARVDGVAQQLRGPRQLALVAGMDTIDGVIGYLAALRAGHVALVVDPDRAGDIATHFDPDVVIADGAIDPRRRGTAHELHPELAVLLSTSGSTGSPKLVRLSSANLQANAESIATFLEISTEDRAALVLPLHYCYGLSVLHSHLARGAGVVLSHQSVVDPGFWASFRRHGATSLAGVPHTFDLLDRVGFESMALPTLRTVTQAGGRMRPERVTRYARLGHRDGWRLFVMYGQTEATARMAFLPPELAERHPGAIGRAIPGGSLTLTALDDEGVGELVYEGPNVMLGYAETPTDLAAGRTTEALHTGDLARSVGDGLFEIVGRRSRFIKPFGLRVDLDRLEAILTDQGIEAACAGDDRRLVVATTAAPDEVAAMLSRHVALPAAAVDVIGVGAIPRRANGKPDHGAVARLPPVAQADTDRSVHALMRDVLGVESTSDDDTFAGLGGDSLSYIEASVRLEALLGHLPPAWHLRAIGEFHPTAAAPTRRWSRVETTVVLRALSIVLVVSTHAGLLDLPGGAHLLLAVAGCNFARFQLPADGSLRRIARIAVPSMLWITVVVTTTDSLRPLNALLLNNLLGPDPGPGLWRYWFIEALVQILLVLACLRAVPSLRRLEARRPYATALTVSLAALVLLLSTDLLGVPDGPRPSFMPHNVVWLFALGWLAERSATTGRRLVLSGLTAVGVSMFFDDPTRAVVVLAGLLLLCWVPAIVSPRAAGAALAMLASSSLWIYLVDWQVQRALETHVGSAVVVVAVLLVGVAMTRLWRAAATGIGGHRRRTTEG